MLLRMCCLHEPRIENNLTYKKKSLFITPDRALYKTFSFLYQLHNIFEGHIFIQILWVKHFLTTAW